MAFSKKTFNTSFPLFLYSQILLLLLFPLVIEVKIASSSITCLFVLAVFFVCEGLLDSLVLAARSWMVCPMWFLSLSFFNENSAA